MGRDTGTGKVAYNWISPDPVKAGPILEGVVLLLLLRTLEPTRERNDF